MNAWKLGAEFTVKKSRFVGAIAPVKTLDDAHKLLKLMKQDHKMKTATHHISAIRVQAGESSILEEANDNGEPPAARRILQILKKEDLSNIIITVLRWYGGKKLGSERFRVIDETARSAIKSWRSTK